MEIVLIVVLFVHALVCAGLSMDLAEKKGHSEGAWFCCGLFLGLFGLIAAAGLPTRQPADVVSFKKRCPDCAELVRKEASVCKFCARQFSKEEIQAELVLGLQENQMTVTLACLKELRTNYDATIIPEVVRVIRLAVTERVDEEIEIRILDEAEQLLVDLGRPPVSQDLVPLLVGYSWGPRKLVKLIKILGVLRDPSCIPFLIKSARTFTYRDSAVSAVVGFGDAALPVLTDFQVDAGRSEKTIVAEIIEKITSDDSPTVGPVPEPTGLESTTETSGMRTNEGGATITVTGGPASGEIFTLSEELVHIGRGEGNQIVILDLGLAEHQASITCRNNRYAIFTPHADAVSIDGSRIPHQRWVWLPESAEILLGESTLAYFSRVASSGGGAP
jgi:hypothetical protein